MTKFKIQDLLNLFIGNICLALAVSYFIIPFNIVSGGVPGVAVALSPLIHINEQLLIDIIIVVTFLLGWLFLGNAFALKTLGSSILYPLLIKLFSSFPYQLQLDITLASVYAGILYGAGMGLIFRTGASSGGMDIPPLIINKFTNIKVSILVMVIDSLTILLGVISYGISAVLIGFVSVLICSLVIDKFIISHGKNAKTVYIISDDYDNIQKQIFTKLNRGVTLLEAYGGYTNQPKKVIMCVVSNSQYPMLHKMVMDIDANAFLIVSQVFEVKGEGFSYLVEE